VEESAGEHDMGTHIQIKFHEADPILQSIETELKKYTDENVKQLFLAENSRFSSAVWLKIFGPLLPEFSALDKLVFVDSDAYFCGNAGGLYQLFSSGGAEWTHALAAEQDQLVRTYYNDATARSSNKAAVIQAWIFGSGWYTTAAGFGNVGCNGTHTHADKTSLQKAYAAVIPTKQVDNITAVIAAASNQCYMPYFGPTGLNTGVVLVKGQKLRQGAAKFVQSFVSIIKKYGPEAFILPEQVLDCQSFNSNFVAKYNTCLVNRHQDAINVYGYLNPEKINVLPCQWNVRTDSLCRNRTNTMIMHGSRKGLWGKQQVLRPMPSFRVTCVACHVHRMQCVSTST
jgi:hypothetical protein